MQNQKNEKEINLSELLFCVTRANHLYCKLEGVYLFVLHNLDSGEV